MLSKTPLILMTMEECHKIRYYRAWKTNGDRDD